MFGEVGWHGSRKSGAHNPETLNAFNKLYKMCHLNNPQCKRQKNSCECFKDMIYYLQNGEYPGQATTAQAMTTDQPTTTPSQADSTPSTDSSTPATTATEASKCWWC